MAWYGLARLLLAWLGLGVVRHGKASLGLDSLNLTKGSSYV